MPVALQNFSEEVLDLIVSFCDQKSTLNALSRVSQLFHRLTLPHLYRKISLGGSLTALEPSVMRCFTFTLLQRPEIAAMVHSISIRPTMWTGYQDLIGRDAEKEPEGNMDSLLRAAIDARVASELETAETDEKKKFLREHRARVWQGVTQTDNGAAFVALTLPILINLQLLDVPFSSESHGAGDRRGFMLYMLANAVARREKPECQRMFASLTDVMIPCFSPEIYNTSVDFNEYLDDRTDSGSRWPDNPLYLALCAGLPAIKRLYGCDQCNQHGSEAAADPPDDEFKKLKPGSSSVELIHLRYSKLKSSNFTALIRAPKCLKTLIYEIGNTRAWTLVEFPQLQLALNAQKACLERLCLSHARYCPFSTDIEELDWPLTFHDFSALRHLRIAPIYLYGNQRLRFSFGQLERDPEVPEATAADIASTREILSEVLPDQLQTLSLLYCSDPSTLQRVLLGLEHLLSLKPDRFPYLHEVSIHGTDSDNLNNMLADFKSLAWKDKGVRFLVMVEGRKARWNKSVPWGWDEDVDWRQCHHEYRGNINVIYDSRRASETRLALH